MAIEDSSTLQAALKNTLVLDTGTGNPSFTRATTATVFDNEEKLITVPSGVARFGGARYVRNRWSHNSDSGANTPPVTGFFNARVNNTSTTVSDPEGGSRAGSYDLTTETGQHYI